MKLQTSKDQLKFTLSDLREKNFTIGLVPTMGALHEGHASLIKQALKENDYVIVSIFVNPTQFNNAEDLAKYPRILDEDKLFLKKISDRIIIFNPSADDIYDGEIKSKTYDFKGLEKEMEGKYRTGHFDGVGTVVHKLLEIVKPEKAYFGEKDFQQLAIIKKMAEIEHLDVEIVGIPIYRHEDGLAMSSRNLRLKPEYRFAAPFIYKILQTAKEKFGTESARSITEWVEEQFRKNELLILEYFIIADSNTLKPIKRKSKYWSYRAFIAVYADDIRLIDNIPLN